MLFHFSSITTPVSASISTVSTVVVVIPALIVVRGLGIICCWLFLGSWLLLLCHWLVCTSCVCVVAWLCVSRWLLFRLCLCGLGLCNGLGIGGRLSGSGS